MKPQANFEELFTEGESERKIFRMRMKECIVQIDVLRGQTRSSLNRMEMEVRARASVGQI